MGITCQLVRLDRGEPEAVSGAPIDVLDFLDRDEPGGRGIDLDQGWSGRLAAFENRPDEAVAQALLAGPPASGDGAAAGRTATSCRRAAAERRAVAVIIG